MRSAGATIVATRRTLRYSNKGGRVRLLIAIPVFNEIRYVERVLQKVKEFAPDVLVIDDGSTDGTAELLEKLGDIRLIKHPTNVGYGQSIIDAFTYADAQGYDW